MLHANSTTMKANEIIWRETQTFIFSTNEHPAGSHYKFVMRLGRVMPTTKAQARVFVQERQNFDVLNNVDVDRIEALMSKHGYSGEYKYTKSRRWVRLTNPEALHDALRKEYCL